MRAEEIASSRVSGANPLRFDSDGDTASDGCEVAWGTSPLSSDPYDAV